MMRSPVAWTLWKVDAVALVDEAPLEVENVKLDQMTKQVSI